LTQFRADLNPSCSVNTGQVPNNLPSSTHLNDEPTGFRRSLRSVRSLADGDGAERIRLIAYSPAIFVIIAVLAIELGFNGIRSSAGAWLPLVEVTAVLTSVLAGTLWFGWGQAQSGNPSDDSHEQR
jgi:uncharacterized membrane protein YtjA (UPF0391 family)